MVKIEWANASRMMEESAAAAGEEEGVVGKRALSGRSESARRGERQGWGVRCCCCCSAGCFR